MQQRAECTEYPVEPVIPDLAAIKSKHKATWEDGDYAGFADYMADGAIEILERYERRRMGDNLAMMAAMEGFRFLYGRSEPGVNWLRNTGMKLFDENRFIKRAAIKMATGQ